MDHDHPDHAALLRAGRERGLSFEVVSGARARRRLPQHLIRDGERTDTEEVRAPRVLVATGTGAGPVCDALGTHVAVLPQVLTWFPIADHDLLSRTEQQVFIRSSRDAQFYGFPSTDGWTMKVAPAPTGTRSTRPACWGSCPAWTAWSSPSASPVTASRCRPRSAPSPPT